MFVLWPEIRQQFCSQGCYDPGVETADIQSNEQMLIKVIRLSGRVLRICPDFDFLFTLLYIISLSFIIWLTLDVNQSGSYEENL